MTSRQIKALRKAKEQLRNLSTGMAKGHKEPTAKPENDDHWINLNPEYNESAGGNHV